MISVLTAARPVLPGIAAARDLLTGTPAGEPIDPAAVLGKKGLRYKDRATRLALTAGRLVLAEAGLLDERGKSVDADMAVVASSNHGNVDTVCRVVRTIAEETTRGVSPMDTANASSNVVASELAIRFGLHGPNLMLCNGATSGLDAVRWADRLVRAGRARRVLVVGVEPDNEHVRALTGTDGVLDGGAALIVESADAARERGVTPVAEIAGCVRAGDARGCVERLTSDTAPGLRLAKPEHGDVLGADPVDLESRFGGASGALGVLQCAASAGWFERSDAPVLALAGTSRDDAVAGVLLRGSGHE